MHASDLITSSILPLSPKDDIGRALDLMEEHKVSHLPVVLDGRLVGMVKDQELEDRNDLLLPVGSAMDSTELVYARVGLHIYEVMKLFSERGLSVVPVLDELGRYRGAITEHDALQKLAQITNMNEPGSVVVLEMNMIDYSLHEIARIVESEDGKILSAYSNTLPGTNRAEVTLKINREDISAILRGFERYDYFVKSTYQGSRFHEDLRERFEELMRYLDT